MLEFQVPVSGIDLREVTDGLFLDSTFVQSHLAASHYNNLWDLFFVNISHEHHYLENPRIGFANGNDTSLINGLFKLYQEEKSESKEEFRMIWSQKPTITDEDEDEGDLFTLYALRKAAESGVTLTNEDVENANLSKLPNDTAMSISIGFNDLGNEKMKNLSSQNVRKYVLIISHNQVLSDPTINAPIDHGYIMIQGGFTKEEAENLSNWINCDAYSRRIGKDKFEKEMKKCR